MPSWTKEQTDAIYKSNSNIIVSAGAGSGKTAVLSERVLEKLKSGVHINELLILTFTKAAALEMKERIRKKIKQTPSLAEELDLIDSAYITTFDSFAMSIVKKYHYLLNVSKSLSIIESSIIEMKKKELLDNIIDTYYLNNDPRFLKLINDFCVKDDKIIKEAILEINNKLDLRIDKTTYLENYIENNYNNTKIKNDINSFVALIKENIEVLNSYIEDLGVYVESDYLNSVNEVLAPLLSSDTYINIKNNSCITLPRMPRGSSDDAKREKDNLKDKITEINDMCIYLDEQDIYNSIMLTKDYVSIIIEIILKFSNEIKKYKDSLDVYEFNDIAIMAIDIVGNEEVKNELKSLFKEIMIDEYQDTSDLQEAFINRIENNNVYMVGDIKQSIYRFRNANPYIFKNKYDNYSKNIGGIKIDLLKNFRSRMEVLDNINTIFNLIMDDDIGGCNYTLSHQMVFGNNTYINEGKTEQNNNFEVLEYDHSKDLGFSKEEIEIFTIAKDIKEKIENKYKVFDKDDLIVRDIKYSDIVILVDRSTNFDLFKKIFTYMQIPLSILKDEKLNTDNDILVLKNLISFIIKVKENVIDNEFKYLFTSLERSFVYNVSDDEIFKYFCNNNFKDSNLYKTSYEISKQIDSISINELLNIIIEKFNFIESLFRIGNINKSLSKLDKLKEISSNLSDIGYDIYKFSDYLKEIIENDYMMTYTANITDGDAVKIMTIHKSKGLEYHICYFPLLYKPFNLTEIKEKFNYDKDFGIITPYFDEGVGKTIYTYLLKNKYTYEEVSEKIRLFYVALTRAKEKMIMILPKSNKEIYNKNSVIIDKNVRKKYKSFASIFYSIENYIKAYYKNIDIENLPLTKDYNKIKSFNIDSYIKKGISTLKVNEISISSELVNEAVFSKNTNKLHTKEETTNMKFGTKVHELLEITDFKTKDTNFIKDKFIKEKIDKLLEQLQIDDDTKIYKEYEFIYKLDNTSYHGIIDLMLEHKEYIDIVDYKLKNTLDEAYIKQLNGYKNYIENISRKKVRIYLYSIIDCKLNSLN